MPGSNRPASWSDAHTSSLFGEPRLFLAARWKTAAGLPARGTWVAAISGLMRVQPDAAAAPMHSWEQASILPCQRPGGLPANAAWSGSLPRADTSFALQQTGRMETEDRRPADWKKPAIPEQADRSRTGHLPGSFLAAATGPARVFSRAAWIAPAAWQTATPFARAGAERHAFGGGPAAGHWAEEASRADREAAEMSAAAHGRPVLFFVSGRIPPSGHELRGGGFPPVRMAREGESQVAVQAWSEGGAPQETPFAALPGGSPARQDRLPRFGFLPERERSRLATAVSNSGRVAGMWLGGSPMIDRQRFFAGLQASRHPQRAAAHLHRPERTATGSVLSNLPPTEATWQSDRGARRMPGQSHKIPNCLSHTGFWPATTFAGGLPQAVRQPARGSLHQIYLWMPAIVVPAWRPTGLSHALRRPAVRTVVAVRSASAPPAPLSATSWWSPGRIFVEPGLAATMPVRPVLPSQWKPDSCAFRVTGPPKVDWGRAEGRSAEWGTAGVSGSTVMLPVCGAVFRVSSFGRQFEFGAGMGSARVLSAGPGPLHHPERLKLPHLVCRFPRTEPASNMGMGGFGSSVFRLSGMSREESFG